MIHLQPSSSRDQPWRALAPDLTPLLDILFILLVFFMLTAGGIFQSLDLKLPSATAQNTVVATESGRVLLEIRKDRYVVDGEIASDLAQLKTWVPEIIREKPNSAFVIAGDREVTIEKLLEVLIYLRSQGIEAADILMRPDAG